MTKFQTAVVVIEDVVDVVVVEAVVVAVVAVEVVVAVVEAATDSTQSRMTDKMLFRSPGKCDSSKLGSQRYKLINSFVFNTEISYIRPVGLLSPLSALNSAYTARFLP